MHMMPGWLADIFLRSQEELGFGWTWLDGVRHSDWQRTFLLCK